jgi:hypothetical protein
MKFLNKTLISTRKFFFSNVDYSYDTRDFLKKVDDYEKKVDDHKDNLFSITNEIIKGHATVEGTTTYSKMNTDTGC